VDSLNKKIDLHDLGLDKDMEKEFEEHYAEYFLGRVAVEYRNSYTVITKAGDLMARVSGKLNYTARFRSDYPAVGDWVVLDRENDETGDAVIHGILTRKSMFSRSVAGKKNEEQAIAVNIDTVFICMAFGHDFNIRRLERYLTIAWDSGAKPVVILTKSDLCEDGESKVLEVENSAVGVDIFVVSSFTGNGVEAILEYIHPRETIAFIGSSGVGKSTLINMLLGEEKQKVNEVRKDERGKHTTSYRELIILPMGGLVIDTPGMRELQVFHGDIDTTFMDINKIAKGCHFSDCQHENEPNCAVKQAVVEGLLTEARLNSYRKLKKELEYAEDREVLNPKLLEKKKIIRMMGSLDAVKKIKNKKPR